MSETELNDTDLNVVMLGFQGKQDMLKACFGVDDKTKPKQKPTAKDLKTFAADHNAVITSKRVR